MLPDATTPVATAAASVVLLEGAALLDETTELLEYEELELKLLLLLLLLLDQVLEDHEELELQVEEVVGVGVGVGVGVEDVVGATQVEDVEVVVGVQTEDDEVAAVSEA